MIFEEPKMVVVWNPLRNLLTWFYVQYWNMDDLCIVSTATKYQTSPYEHEHLSVFKKKFPQRFKKTQRWLKAFLSLPKAWMRITELITALCIIIKIVIKHQKWPCVIFLRRLLKGEKHALFIQNMLITKEYSNWCEACKTYFQNKA